MKHFLTIVLLTLVLIVATPTSTHAGGAITGIDPVQALKEWGMDTVAWFIGGLMSGDLTRSTADWVNSGFGALARSVQIDPITGEPYVSTFYAEGGSSFVLNPQAFFQELSTGAATNFFDELVSATDPAQAFDTIFPGFRDELLQEIARETQGMTGDFFQNFVSDFQGSEGEARFNAYLSDFTEGGWDTFLQVTQNCANNYGCTRLVVLDEMNKRTQAAQTQAQTELEQGGGFLTMRTCTQHISDIPAQARSGFSADPTGCVAYDNVTPGKLLGDQIVKATNIEFDRATSSDELTEVLVTLLEQAMSTLINQGLSALSNQLSANYSREGGIRDQNRERAAEIDRNIDNLRDDLVDATRGEGGQEKCATFGSGETRLCSNVSSIALSEHSPRAQITVTHSSGADYEADIEIDFPAEYRDHIQVNREAFSFSSGNSVTLTVELVRANEIQNPGDLSGSIVIGDLVIDVSGSSLGSTSGLGSTPGCANVESGQLCTASTNVNMVLDRNGATHAIRVSYYGSGTLSTVISSNFGEFDGVINVTPGDVTSFRDLETKEVRLTISNPNSVPGNFSTLNGTLTIGPLEIAVRGIDRR